MPPIVCDNREHALIDILKARGIEFEVSQLDVGDFVIGDTESSIIIERKTMDDLSASIIDGRYSEQKQRLKSCTGPNCHVLYIVERFTKTSNRGVPHATLINAMLSCMLKTGFYVMRTRDADETACVLCSIASRYANTGSSSAPIVPHVRRRDFEDPYINMLSCIPGISASIAMNIKAVYPTMNVLIREFQAAEESDAPRVLCGIQRIGPKLSRAVYTHLCC